MKIRRIILTSFSQLLILFGFCLCPSYAATLNSVDEEPLRLRSLGVTVKEISSDADSRSCGKLALAKLALVLKGNGFDANSIRNARTPKAGFTFNDLLSLSEENQLGLAPVEWNGKDALVVPSLVHWKRGHYSVIVDHAGTLYYKILDPFSKPKWLTVQEIQNESSGNFLIPFQHASSNWRLLSKLETSLIVGQGCTNSAPSLPPPDPDGGCNGGPLGGGGGPSGGGNGASGSGNGNHGGKSSFTAGGGNQTTPNSPGGSCPSCNGSPGAASNGSQPIFPPGKGGGGGTGVPGGNGGGNGTPGGTGRNQPCPDCSQPGMAYWRVSEPYLNLWIYDEPIGYQPAIGERMSFLLAYQQRNIETNLSGFGPGPGWNCSWVAYVDELSPTDARLYLAGGGQRNYVPNQYEFFSRTTLARTPNTPGALQAYAISYPDGKTEIYSLLETNSGVVRAYLTSIVTPKGTTNRFLYDRLSGGAAILKHVVDADSRTNTLNYTNALFPTRITSVQDAFERTAYLQYNNDGLLSSITDPVNLVSSFGYNTNNWITNMTTPYGPTTFVTEDRDVINGSNNITRAVQITEPDGGKELFMYRWNSQYLDSSGSNVPLLPNQYYGPMVPNDAPIMTVDNEYMQTRNTFHWDKRHFAACSTNDYHHFTTNDYNRAYLKHWLRNTDWEANPQTTGIISMERDPSPDAAATLPGQFTWYDYWGKPDAQTVGTNSLADCAIQMLPSGEQWFYLYFINERGHPTERVETYSDGSMVATRTNSYVYDALTGVDLLHEIGPDGVTNASYTYTGNHQVATFTNSLGEGTVFTYNDHKQLLTAVEPGGLIISNYYYLSGNYQRWLQTRSILGFGEETYTYTNGLVETFRNERGFITTNTWDNLQRIKSESDPRGSISYEYDKLDLYQIVDRMGFANTFGHDAMRRMIAFTNAMGYYTLYNYCTCGALDSVRDAMGSFTYYYYDATGRLTNTVYPDGSSLTNQYNLMGQLVITSDNANRNVTNSFNNQGRIYAISNYFGQVQKTFFNIKDQATNTITANGVSVTNFFDSENRLTKLIFPDGGIVQGFYSPLGLTNIVDQAGRGTTNTFNAASWKKAERNANGEVNSYTYDRSGNLIALTDAKGQTTSWTYDIFGLVSNKVDAATNVILIYHYDANERLTNVWSREKLNTYYFYDATGNLTNITYYTSPAISFAYDALNRMTNMIDSVGTTKFDYTSTGQLFSEDGPWANDKITYNYSSGLRSALSLQQPNSSPWMQTYTYDGAKRLVNITSPAGAFIYEYGSGLLNSPATLAQKLSFANGAYITNYYGADGMARLHGTWLKNSADATLNAHTYVYNLLNERTKQTRLDGSYVIYDYDKVGQLTNAIGYESGGTPRLNENLNYGYDDAHNLKMRANNALIQNFTVNSLNELTTANRNITNALTVSGTTSGEANSVTVSANGGGNINAELYLDKTFAAVGFTPMDGNNTFTATASDAAGRTDTTSIAVYLPASAAYLYDENGNLLSDGKRAFNYGDENQLLSITVSNVWKTEFIYDGKMRRRIRRESTWQNSSWIQTNEVRYIYDGNFVIQERNFNNLSESTYTRGLDFSHSHTTGSSSRELLAWSQSSLSNPQHYYYHTDGSGNVTGLINTSQFLVAKYIYDPFGNTISASGSMANVNPYKFSSCEFHANSGLIYYLYRFYDPSLQRWLNRDPIEEAGGINLFAFVDNNPIKLNDVFGLHPEVDLAVAIQQGNAEAIELILDAEGETLSAASKKAAEAALKRLRSKCADLIRGSLKKVKNYPSEWENKTYEEILKDPSQKAKILKKLIEQSKRLMEKQH